MILDYMFGLLIAVTLIAAYFPIIFIRKMDKMLESLKNIEANTRKL